MRRGIVFLTLLIVIVFSDAAYSQNINGHWYGIGVLSDVKGSYNSYLTELTIRQKGKTVWGEFQYYFMDSLVKVPVKGIFDKDTRRLTIQPFPVIYYRSPSARNSIECVMGGYFRLVASKQGSVLQGGLVADEDHRYTIPDINYRLKHSNDTVELVMKDGEIVAKRPVIIPPAPAIAKPPVEKQVDKPLEKPIEKPVAADTKTVDIPGETTMGIDIAKPVTPLSAGIVENFFKRNKEVERVLEVNNSTLRLEIYDNGEVDNDSISVFFNNAMILPGSKLDISPIKLNIQLDSTLEYNELGMLALNLGTLPPNTALLVLYDGKTRHEIFLTSDLGKSAVLRIRRKKQ